MAPHALWSGVTLLGAASFALADSVWIEPGGDDAGALPGEAQVTLGEGALALITGTLGGGEDLEDMFVIEIVDPAEFSATTSLPPGMTAFDSRLFLFEIGGAGLLGNEDTALSPPGRGPEGETGACCFPNGACGDLSAPNCTGAGGTFQGEGTTCATVACPDPEGSTMGNSADDGTGVVVATPGTYLLAVGTSPRGPNGAPLGPIFALPLDSTEVSGPDGPGGAVPITHWSGSIPPRLGDYAIALTGCAFAAPPGCNGDIDGNGSVDVVDFLALLANWGPCDGCPADVNGDGVVGINDLLAVLFNWGAC